MKILVITADGFGSAMGTRFVKEGCQVKLWIKDKHAQEDMYEGLLDRIDDYRKARGWADLVVFMNNHLVQEWKECMAWGIPVYGGSEAGENLEHDRPAAQKLAKSFGLEVPKNTAVKTVDEAIAYLEKNKGPMVCKFVGGNTDSDDVLLGEYEDNRDLIRFCRFIENSGKKWDAIDIDEFVQGIEVGVADYFDGKKMSGHPEINFQMKRFASGENGNGVGFLTGEMGTLIKYVTTANAFYQKTLAKMIPHLTEIGYRGQIDIGTIVRVVDGKIVFIENTPREGIPDYPIRYEIEKSKISDLFYSVAKGDVQDREVGRDWAIGAVMVSPGFPDPKSSEKRSVGLPILGYEENKDHCALFEAKKGKDGFEICKGGYGYPCVVTEKGPTIESAQRRLYWRLNRANPKRVCVPKSWYRSDLGDRVIESKDEIIELGIMTQEEWDS